VSTDKEKLNMLAQKLDELTKTLNKVSEELKSVLAQIKTLSTGQNAQPPNQAPVAAAPSTEKKRSLDDIRLSFPEELESRLSFEEKGDYIIIKPKQFLGSENFAKIASAVRGMGGEYISAGKDSHFRVPKKKA
jgi:seryl-tRNA synthetase